MITCPATEGAVNTQVVPVQEVVTIPFILQTFPKAVDTFVTETVNPVPLLTT